MSEEQERHQDISATEPDWNRERVRRFWDPGRQLLRSIREYQACDRTTSWGRLRSHHWVARYRFWSTISASDIPLNCRIAGGLKLTHPNGVVIHPEATIGPNCLILQQVTLVQGVTVGGHVDFGAGAKVVRPVHIGDHAKIGANAVVVHDVPAGATVVGVPAKPVGATTRADQPLATETGSSGVRERAPQSH